MVQASPTGEQPAKALLDFVNPLPTDILFSKHSCLTTPRQLQTIHPSRTFRHSPQDTPPPPVTGAATKPSTGASAGAEKASEEEYALGPFARAAKSMQPTPAPEAAAPTPGNATAALATAAHANRAAGWAPAPTGNQPVDGAASHAKPRGMTSLFNLGYGTNHPKYEAAKARTQGAAQRSMEAAGGRSFHAEGAKKLGLVTKGDTAGKRKREDGGAAPKVKVSKEEADALAKRAAARARVEARTMKTFGLS